MTSPLALATLQLPTPTPDGQLTLGGVKAPGHVWADYLVRCLERCGDVPEAVAARVRVREHLDRVFSNATPVHVRSMQDGATGRFPAIRDGRRVVVRLGDSVTATLLDEGERARGFACQWRDDPIFGCVSEVMRPFARYSCSVEATNRLRSPA